MIRKYGTSKTESTTWNGVGADTIHHETIIPVVDLDVVAVDLPAMTAEGVVTDEDEAIAPIRNGLLRRKEAKMIIRRIVVVLTGEVAVATVLLQKEAIETRTKEATNAIEDVVLEVTAAVKDRNSPSNSRKKKLVRPD